MVELAKGAEQQPREHITITAPANEMFSDQQNNAELWCPEVSQDPNFATQLTEHNERVRVVNETLDLLPTSTLSFQEAFDTGILSNVQIKSIYTHLSKVLSDPDYSRLALYLPFELLPSSDWQPSDTDLTSSLATFRSTYIRAWYSLLDTEDVRANFVDGDVLETNLRDGDLPRVIKATHLIPEILDRGLLDRSDVMALYDSVESPLLRQGITEGLRAYDLEEVPEIPEKISVTEVIDELEFLARGGFVSVNGPTTERRTLWLTQVRMQSLIDIYSENVYSDIIRSIGSVTDIASVATIENRRLASTLFITGFQKVIERSDSTLAGHIYERYETDLIRLYETNDIKIRDLLNQTFRQSYHRGVCPQTVLDNLGIVLPKLSGDLSTNLEYMSNELLQITNALDAIRVHPSLSKLLYPIMSMGGSRLKGYGEQTSDIDVGIFIQPTTLESQKEEIRESISAIFLENGMNDAPFEVWLDKDGLDLAVRELSDDGGVTADRYWTHILFGTAWVGDETAVQAIRKKLLPTYFQANIDTTNSYNSRRLYLEQLEQDALQYRLMHKGYVRHFPKASYKKFQDKKSIDGGSIFWDSGYRQLATRLFIEKVFLPKL